MFTVCLNKKKERALGAARSHKIYEEINNLI